MFFLAMDRALDAVELEQAASLCAACDLATQTQPAARAWVQSLQAAPGALIVIGKESDTVFAFAAGTLEGRKRSVTFHLQELCVSNRRKQSGIGAELLTFTLRQASMRGAIAAVASARLENRGATFLTKHGFARVAGEGGLRRPLPIDQ